MTDPRDEETAPTIAAGSGPGVAKESIDTLRTAPASGLPATALREYPALLQIDPAHYIRERELARGGMGRIVVAHDRRLGRDVAIKEIVDTDHSMRVRFEREARITARLQHPSTIAVHEAGVWPTGEPFFAMPLVSGRSLDKVIQSATTLEARFGLIANVLAVADTLAHAHGRRIIHRDLKPGNVLVGDFGETVVIDWGLAKDLDASADESLRPSKPAASSASASNATEHGVVLGTPSYMPPEQADGQPVDERADVYALGAMLYHVLSGAPPYTGRSAEAVLAEVIAGPPRPLRELVPQVPTDLLTIVAKAMARAPHDRFRTAKELSAELRKFQTGQLVASHRYSAGELVRRWIAKHRTSLVVAAVALIALAALGAFSVRRIVRERAAAEHARLVADQQRGVAVQRDAEARDLVTFMLGDLHKKLESVGKLDLLDSVARKVVAYYDHRGADDSPADLMERANAAMAIGDVLVSRGTADAGRAQYEAARAFYERVLAADPKSIEAEVGIATSEDRRAQGLYGSDSKGTETAAREAIRRTEDVLKRAPDRLDAAFVQVEAQRSLGDTLLDRGDAAGADAAYRAAAGLAKTFLAKQPADPQWLRVLAINESQLSGLLLMQGDADGALAAEREDLRLSEQIATGAPRDTRAENDVAGAHLRLGDVFLNTGKKDAALAEFRTSLVTMKHLTLLDPTNADWQHDLCSCHDRIGKMLLEGNDTKGARASFDACREIREQIVARDPHSAARPQLAASHNKLGNVFETEKKNALAFAEYQKSLAILEAVVADDPQDASVQRDLSVSYYLNADILLALRRPVDALADARKALAITQTLVTKDATNVIWRGDVIDCHMQVGKMLVALSKLSDARIELEAAHALAVGAATADPQEPTWANYVKQTEQNLRVCCGKK